MEKNQDIDKVIRTGDPLNTDQRNNELSRHVVKSFENTTAVLIVQEKTKPLNSTPQHKCSIKMRRDMFSEKLDVPKYSLIHSQSSIFGPTLDTYDDKTIIIKFAN